MLRIFRLEKFNFVSNFRNVRAFIYWSKLHYFCFYSFLQYKHTQARTLFTVRSLRKNVNQALGKKSFDSSRNMKKEILAVWLQFLRRF